MATTTPEDGRAFQCGVTDLLHRISERVSDMSPRGSSGSFVGVSSGFLPRRFTRLSPGTSPGRSKNGFSAAILQKSRFWHAANPALPTLTADQDAPTWPFAILPRFEDRAKRPRRGESHAKVAFFAIRLHFSRF